jgi:hypothetical protein
MQARLGDIWPRSRKAGDIWPRSRVAGDIGPRRLHPSMVAHQRLSTRIVVQIDTQQLPSAGTGTTARDVPAEMPTFAVGTGFHPVGLTEGHQIFVDALTRFAERSGNPRLTPIIDCFAVSRCVAVQLRRGR